MNLFRILLILSVSSVYSVGHPPVLLARLAALGATDTPTEADIQQAIDKAIRSGGGEVRIPAGTLVLEKGLRVENARNLRIVGADRSGTILKLPPVTFAETAELTLAGSDKILLKRQQRMASGMLLRIEAPGEIDSFTKEPKPYQAAKVKSIADGVLILEQPLAFPVPAGTLIRDRKSPNVITIRGASDGVHIDNLTLDGGRTANDPHISGHAQLCGVFAQGKYTYESGPVEPVPSHIVVTRCTIRNCHGRGVAFYSVQDSEVSHCEISDTTDEAVDLDHFSVRVSVHDNELRHSSEGMELNDANDCVVKNNRFIECGVGINLWQFTKLAGWNECNVIEDNRFEKTKKTPIQIQKGLTKNKVSGNTIVPP